MQDASAKQAAELAARNRALATLAAVADTITYSLDFEGTAQRIVDAVLEHTEYPAVTLYTVAEDEQSLELAAHAETEPLLTIPERGPLSHGLAWEALSRVRVVSTPNHQREGSLHDSTHEFFDANAFEGMAMVPLLFDERVVGILGLTSREPVELDEHEQSTLLTLGKTAAATLMSARHVRSIEREIEERVRAEKELRESEGLLRTIMENAASFFYLIDATSGDLLYLSPNFERITGSRPEPLIGNVRASLELVHREDRERVSNLVLGDQGLRETSSEFRLTRPDGEIVEILQHSTLVMDAEGNPSRIAGFAQDVTGQRSLERQVRHSQKMDAVGRLASGMAHDFNNLLTVIAGYGGMLCNEVEPESPSYGHAREVMRATESASRLTRRLLTFVQKQPVDLKGQDLVRIILDVAPMLRSLLGETVRFAIEIEGKRIESEDEIRSAGRVAHPDLNVFGDAGQLEQVLVNLAINASDAMPDGGEFQIGVRRLESGRVGLQVRDTGLGMEPSVRERAFEPLFSTKEPGSGTGLGLANVREIVEQGGGRIRLESAPGTGTCIDIDLASAPSEPERAQSEAPERTEGRETVLLVEDQDAVRWVAKYVLEGQGYRVIEARNASEALGLATGAAAECDLLLTDMVMPGLSGPKLAAEIRRERPNLPILFMSGYTGHDGQGIARDQNEHFLAKPFDANSLSRAVRAALDARAERG